MSEQSVERKRQARQQCRGRCRVLPWPGAAGAPCPVALHAARLASVTSACSNAPGRMCGCRAVPSSAAARIMREGVASVLVSTQVLRLSGVKARSTAPVPAPVHDVVCAGQGHLHCTHTPTGEAAVPGHLRDCGVPKGATSETPAASSNRQHKQQQQQQHSSSSRQRLLSCEICT